MNSTFKGSRRVAVAAAVLALSCLEAQAQFVAQGIGGGAPADSTPIGNGTSITLPANVVTTRENFLGGLSIFTVEEFNTSRFSAASILGGNGSIGSNDGNSVLKNFGDSSAVFNGRWDTSASQQTASGGWFENGASSNISEYIEVLLSFATLQNAVGFYLTDYGDFGSGVELELFDGATSLGKQAVTGAATVNASVTFFGVYSPSAFTSFRLHFNQACDTGCDDVIGLDSLVVGVQKIDSGTVPEPGTLWLVGGALLAAGRFTRRTRG